MHFYFPSVKQALGLQRDDVFSNTMLTTSIEQLVKETTPCIGTRTLDSILFNCEGCFTYLFIYFYNKNDWKVSMYKNGIFSF